MLPTNLTAEQSDYAKFLPALSTFYALFVGRQRREAYITANRMPGVLNNGMESMNWLDNQGLWQYKWSLHSAGHASLELGKDMYREDMYRVRDRNASWILGDSGGFQIGKGKWEGDWRQGSGCEKAHKKRDGVLRWMDAYMDYGMILDIPAWVGRSPEGAKASKINTYQEAVDGTKENNDYWIKHRTGECKFLNVLQGENFAQADDWYDQMKGYCDPKQHEMHFNGWAMGGQNMCDLHLALRRTVILGHDGLLEKGKQDVMHFLGTSKLEWAMVLTALQRGIRKQFNENFEVTFDCASPFLCTANGQHYTGYRMPQDGKWSYLMESAPDDKVKAGSTTPWNDVCDAMYDNWIPSPITNGLIEGDICQYGVNDVNKNGKVGNTSWDSFSYMLMMNHNVYTHLRSVQLANKLYDEGKYPHMLVDSNFDKTEVKDVIARIFEIDDRDKQLKLIEDHSKLWMKVIGTRGAVGKKTVNASASFNNLFSEV